LEIYRSDRQGRGITVSATGGFCDGAATVTRADFERLRDIDQKVIASDVRFAQRRPLLSLMAAEGIPINNANGVDARLDIHYNPDVGSKIFTVIVPTAGGPICRLCVDGRAHAPCGRSHKHSLWTDRCPRNNLPLNVVDRPDLSGQSIEDLFDEFCTMARIQFSGTFYPP
jgi:hypothetical protein